MIKSLFHLYKNIERKETILKMLKEKDISINTALSHTKIRRPIFGSRVENRTVQIVDLEKEIKELKKDFEERRKEIMKKINKVDNSLYRDILFLRYICFEKWEDIAEILNYSERHIRRLHRQAVNILHKNFKERG